MSDDDLPDVQMLGEYIGALTAENARLRADQERWANEWLDAEGTLREKWAAAEAESKRLRHLVADIFSAMCPPRPTEPGEPIAVTEHTELPAMVHALTVKNARLRALVECPDDRYLDAFEQGFEKGNPVNWEWVFVVLNRRDAENARLRAVVTDIGHAVRAMQSMHARLGTGDDPDEEAAFLSVFHEAVIDVLDLELPADLLTLDEREST